MRYAIYDILFLSIGGMIYAVTQLYKPTLTKKELVETRHAMALELMNWQEPDTHQRNHVIGMFICMLAYIYGLCISSCAGHAMRIFLNEAVTNVIKKDSKLDPTQDSSKTASPPLPFLGRTRCQLWGGGVFHTAAL